MSRWEVKTAGLPYFRCLRCGVVYKIGRHDFVFHSRREGEDRDVECKSDTEEISLEEATAAMLAGKVNLLSYSCMECYKKYLERVRSSVGPEQVAHNHLVGGSSPSGPTKRRTGDA